MLRVYLHSKSKRAKTIALLDSDTFLTEYLGYLMLNQGVPGFESPIQQVTMALTLIKREKVDLWVKNMLDSLRILHLVQHNVPAV